ncbi:MAG: penicillin-binding protein 2 [Treponemataceae bacterium]|nr:penicillin-binding protein 2 [Treponemataceae bacterium]
MNTFKRPIKYSDNSDVKKHDTRVLSIICILIFSIFIITLFSLQVVSGGQYKKESEDISSQTRVIDPRRGEIYDRNVKDPLVINTDAFAVDVTPGEIPPERYDTVILRLSDIIGVSKESIDRKIPKKERKNYTSYEILSEVSPDIIFNLAENSTDLPGVSWRLKPMRTYVNEDILSLAHIIGYIGDISTDEYKILHNKGYSKNSIIGKTGIEKEYDLLLRGKSGLESRTVDVKGRYLSEDLVIKEPEMGKNLVLTIDERIQKLAEQALGPRLGAAVVLRPADGEILAMVSYPSFNPNEFYKDRRLYSSLLNNTKNPLINRAINATYAPASTFKVIMATAMLEENAFPSSKRIDCNGVIEYGGRPFKCHIGIPGHGNMDLKNGLAQSCNVYFWTIGRDYLGLEVISSYAKMFGYGQSAKIDISPQRDGFVPSSKWKERRYHEPWLGGDTMNMSIGQGYTQVTPLQVADMMAMVCNDGKVYKPHLLKEIRDPITNEVVSSIEKEVLLTSHVKKEVWSEVKEDLRYTVTDGSAQFPLRNRKVKMAGKTGTAEVTGYGKNHFHSWFVCYAPYDAPVEEQVVVCVLVEAANEWEWWAPYCSNIIIQGIFANQTYEQAITELGFKYLMKPIGRQE